MNSGPPPVFLTVIDWGALVVPVSRAAKVSEEGVSVTAGAEEGVGGGVGEGVEAMHPGSRAAAEGAPSVTSTWHVDELYGEVSMRNWPLASLVPGTAPGVPETACFGRAPVPSTRSWVPFSSARVM